MPGNEERSKHLVVDVGAEASRLFYRLHIAFGQEKMTLHSVAKRQLGQHCVGQTIFGIDDGAAADCMKTRFPRYFLVKAIERAS